MAGRGRPQTNLRALEIAACELAKIVTSERKVYYALMATQTRIEQIKRRMLRSINPS